MRGQKGVNEADEKEVVAPLRLLELFSGTGSVGRAFEKQGWEVISIDTDPQAQATFRQDITRWDCASLLGKKIDVIWASPPAQIIPHCENQQKMIAWIATSWCERHYRSSRIWETHRAS